MMNFKLDCKHSNYKIKSVWVLFWYRLNNMIYYSNLPKIIKKLLLVIFKVLQMFLVEIMFTTEIHYESKLGGGIRLPHPFGVIINRNVKIGLNCTIFQFVTIGSIEGKGITDKAPQIGNNVYIGAGGKILGNIKIGNNVKIGANAVVVKDIPDNCTVVGNPMKII